MDQGPFKYIENGYVKGLEKLGCSVKIWYGQDNAQLNDILRNHQPELFIGFLRSPGDYNNFAWTRGKLFESLNQYRNNTGMKVAVQANPDLQDYVKGMDLTAVGDDFSTGISFVSQPATPTKDEQALVDASFIDLVRHHYSRRVAEQCLTFWSKNGVRILDEPLAADETIYTRPLFPRIKKYDITYIGGWWPFKGKQMDRHLLPMNIFFGNNLAVFGKDWPHLSRGVISDKDYVSVIYRSKINIVFHEPILVQGLSVHVNERIFKLYAMGAFAICDNNPCLREYFNDDEIVIAENPEDMIEKCAFYLKNPSARRRIAAKGHKAVMERHTYEVRARKLLESMRALD